MNNITATTRRNRTRRIKSSKEEMFERKRAAFNRLKAFYKEYQAMTPEQQKTIDTAAAKLGNYSDRNKTLIYLQAQDRGFEPSAVCPFSAWKKVGRYVKQGETGLAILVPSVKKGQDAPTAEDGALVVYGHDFDINDGSTPEAVNFKVAYVFDISQTELLAGADETPALPETEREPAALPCGQLLLDLGAA